MIFIGIQQRMGLREEVNGEMVGDINGLMKKAKTISLNLVIFSL